jgi:radical SAM enzyme (TIGR01210 family)
MAVISTIPEWTDRDILAARGPKEPVDPWQPIASLVEPERQADGRVHDVATIFLANRECPFRCVYCDLWRHTLDEPTPRGAVPRQIDLALERLPAASIVKLYNSGNVFDAAAIPPEDWPAIADRVRGFERVIVENHPRLIDERCLRFRELLDGTRLEVAMGLETIHPEVLARMNKRMTLDDFTQAARFLVEHDLDVRAFVLLRPPFLSEAEGVDWALRSITFAFDCGVTCVSVIPTRAGNGLMDRLQLKGLFSSPKLASLEHVLAAGIGMQRGRVFADTWDAARFADCSTCAAQRIERLRQMNLSQTIRPDVVCPACLAAPK